VGFNEVGGLDDHPVLANPRDLLLGREGLLRRGGRADADDLVSGNRGLSDVGNRLAIVEFPDPPLSSPNLLAGSPTPSLDWDGLRFSGPGTLRAHSMSRRRVWLGSAS
jgi:hypothetical protein